MSFFSSIELSCVFPAVLFFFGKLLNIIHRSLLLFLVDEDSYDSRLELDPTFLHELWSQRSKYVGLKTAAGMVNVIAWFALCVPVLQTAWTLSMGGKRHLGTHVFLVGLVVTGSTIEAISRLMVIGIDSVCHFMANDFNLSSWNYKNDGIGWRVLEIVYDSSNGVIAWVDAFEWLALSGILVIIYASVDAERMDKNSILNFSYYWTYHGLLAGTLCWVDFLAEVMRVENYTIFQLFAILVSAFNMLILLPSWLLYLGKQLYKAKPVYYDFSLPTTDFSTSDITTAFTMNDQGLKTDESERNNMNGMINDQTDSNDVSESTPVFEIS